MSDERIKSLIEQFGANNQSLSVKNRTTKAVVAQFVSNCAKSDRLASLILLIFSSSSVDARLRARMREQSERLEEQKRNIEEKDKAHDKIMQESAPEGFVWSGGMEGEYHWAGEGEQPEHIKESKFWHADFNDMQPVTKEDEERFEKQKEVWLNYEIQKMREEKSQYMRNYQYI